MTPATQSPRSTARAETSPTALPEVQNISLPIEGMTCASCVNRVERALERVPGVQQVRVNLATERAELSVARSLTRESLVAAVEQVGYGVPQPDVVANSASTELQQASSLSARSSGADLRAAHLLPLVWRAALLSLPVFLMEMGGHLVPAVHHWVQHELGREASWSLQLLLTSLVLLGPGRELLLHGVRALLRLAPDMNSLVALGALSAFAYSCVATLTPSWLPANAQHVYFESAAVLITWILLGRYLEAKAKSRTSEAIARIARLAPTSAVVQRNGNWVEVPVRDVVVGDVLLVRPGARIAADGSVLDGESHVDESMLSGEPMPVLKQAGMKLSAGSVNQLGSFSMQVSAVAGQTVLAQILRLVEQAQASKLPIQALADRVTRWFVPCVLAAAALTAVLWYFLGPEPRLTLSLVNAINVLIVACPCALGLATPTSILVGTGRGAELGLLFRQGEALQRLQATKVVALDKTGTLTLGRPEVTDWETAQGYTRAQVLPLLAALESRSQHPIARAIVEAAEREKLELPPTINFVTDVGGGIHGSVLGKHLRVGSARYLSQHGVDMTPVTKLLRPLETAGKTVLAVALDGSVAAVLAVSDPLRPEAVVAVQQLKALGLQLAMISGDSNATARAVASKVGIETVVAEVLPAGKVAALQQLRDQYGSVTFVGDGINDAPVLAEADVGIALGAGTDVAMEAADVVLMRNDLSAVSTAIALSRATLRNIRQNLFWAFAYNAALLPVAAGALYPNFGILLSPVFGAFAMALSSVFVLGNALRLRRFSVRVTTDSSVDDREGSL